MYCVDMTHPTNALEQVPLIGQSELNVRSVLLDGKPWFVLSDLCAILGTKNVTQVARRLPKSDVSEAKIMGTKSGTRTVIVINESGFVQLVMTSRSTASHDLRQWMSEQVLPEIKLRAAMIKYRDAYESYLVEIEKALAAEDLETATRLLIESKELQKELNELIGRDHVPLARPN